jgi:hypothetical protein
VPKRRLKPAATFYYLYDRNLVLIGFWGSLHPASLRRILDVFFIIPSPPLGERVRVRENSNYLNKLSNPGSQLQPIPLPDHKALGHQLLQGRLDALLVEPYGLGQFLKREDRFTQQGP